MALIDSAGAGDIISMAGMASPVIGHTVANVEVYTSLFAQCQWGALPFMHNIFVVWKNN